MDTNSILIAINEAKHERELIAKRLLEMEALQRQLYQLETFIAQGELLIGEKKQDEHRAEELFPMGTHPQTSISELSGEIAEPPNWEKMRMVYLENGNKFMRLSEMVREFRKRNWPLSEKNPREVLRGTVKAKKDIFEHDVARGAYRLKEERPLQSVQLQE